MPTPIRQFKDSSNTVHDYDNRYITLSAASGTLTTDQLAVLQESSKNYIVFQDFIYTKTGETSSNMYYAYLGDAPGTPPESYHFYFSITKSSRAYTRVTRALATEDWVTNKGYTTNTGTVTSITIKGTSPITVDSASAITTSGTRTISHANSGATAGSYGDSSAQTPAYGGTFKVPYVTVNATGHVTGISEHTVKIPASDNTDTKVTQTATTTNADYEVLFSETADNTTRTEGARKNSNLKFNPSTGNLQTTQINGVTVGSSPKFTDTTYSEATTSTAGLMSSGDKTKLNGIATGAEVNQNAFANVTVGSTTIAADAKQDTLTLAAGSNVTLTPDATNDKVTIAATDTTYGAGTGLSLSGTTFNHSNSITAGTAGTSSATSGSTLAVPYVTYDAQGHVTASGTHTHTVSGFLTSHQTIKQDGVTGATVNRFGTCSTAAATAAKAVTITTGTFSLEAGAQVAVKFSNANTANSPTLNVGSTGAKNIFVNGAQITSGGNKALLAGTVIFIYDGTQYHLIGNYYDTNTSAVTGVKGNSESSYRTGNVNLTAANIGAAASDHTHTTSLASGGTSTVDLAANTAYTLTAGGTSVVFKTPADNNTTYSAGTGLSLSSTTFNHSNSVTAGTAGTSSATSGSTLAVPYVTYDAQGHVTASGTHTHTVTGFSTTDTKNTAGSTDTSSKIFLVGATSQAANPQTYSDNQVYVTNGQLDANTVRIAEAVTMVYDSTNKCINFNFA